MQKKESNTIMLGNERQLRRKSRPRKRPFEGLMPSDVRRSCLDCQADIQLFRLSFNNGC